MASNFLFTSTTVISELDNVTVCEEREQEIKLTCVLNGSISSDGVQWHRLVKGTNTAQRVSDLGNDFVNVLVPDDDQNELTATLYIFKVKISYTGYYWVKLPSDDVCNISLTVGTSTYVCLYV